MSVRVTNSGKKPGDEVVELYLTHLGIEGAPLRALAGFQHVRLEPGESKTATFSLHDRDLSVVDGTGVRRILPGEVKVWIGGGEPVSGPEQSSSAVVQTGFRISSAATLPE